MSDEVLLEDRSERRSAEPRRGGLGPVLLALFVHAGQIKSNPLLAWIPGDLAVLLGLWLVLIVVTVMVKERALPKLVLLPLALAAVLAIGLPGIVNDYGRDKAQSFFVLTLLGMVCAAVVLRTAWQRVVFLRTLVGLGIGVAILVTVAPERVSEWSSVVTLAGTNTISTSQMIMNGAIGLFAYAMVRGHRIGSRIWALIAAAFMCYTALSTGSRGPVLGVALALSVALLVAPVFAGRRARAVVACIILGGLALLFLRQGASDGVTRVAAFLSGGRDTSTDARAYFWGVAVAGIPERPFGGGWGTFGVPPELAARAGVGGRLYPHNLWLEISYEAGWMAGGAFLILVVAALFFVARRAADPVALAFLMLLVYTLFNAMVSGDVNDNRLMWVLLVAVWTIPKSIGNEGRGVPSRRPSARLKRPVSDGDSRY